MPASNIGCFLKQIHQRLNWDRNLPIIGDRLIIRVKISAVVNLLNLYAGTVVS